MLLLGFGVGPTAQVAECQVWRPETFVCVLGQASLDAALMQITGAGVPGAACGQEADQGQRDHEDQGGCAPQQGRLDPQRSGPFLAVPHSACHPQEAHPYMLPRLLQQLHIAACAWPGI